jgi:hypothetical protein
VLGYAYEPGGPGGGQPLVILQRSEVAHFAPIPDPLSPYRGMSWLTPIMREIGADMAMVEHRSRFFEQGATPNMVVSLDPNVTKAAFDAWVETFKGAHEGTANAYRTIYLGAGAKVEVVGQPMVADFKTIQGGGETRIAAAGGVPPIIVGLSEGLAAATYSNYGQARRAFSDLTMRTLWRNVCGSLETIVPHPPMSELWYDDRDIKFLQDDQLDQSTIQSTNAQSIKALLDAGFDPDAAIEAITANDLGRLKGKHSGLFSVQLQPPQPDGPPEPEPGADEAVPEETPVEQAGRVLAEGFGIIRAYAEREQPAPIINVTTPDVNVTIEAPQVHVGRDAIRLTEYVPTRTVIDRDPQTGAVMGSHEEPAGDVKDEPGEELTE